MGVVVCFVGEEYFVVLLCYDLFDVVLVLVLLVVIGCGGVDVVDVEV